jgi:hypothetical protein
MSLPARISYFRGGDPPKRWSRNGRSARPGCGTGIAGGTARRRLGSYRVKRSGTCDSRPGALSELYLDPVNRSMLFLQKSSGGHTYVT